MSRSRKYKSNAERQQAYRERKKKKKEVVQPTLPATHIAIERANGEVVYIAKGDLATFRGPDPK